jgi:Xaa-Pro aminopeptidase
LEAHKEMKNDLDGLMRENGIDALLVNGRGQHNPNMVYLTGGPRHMTQADIIKKAGSPPVLFCAPMERDEAANSGLQTINYNQYPWADLLKKVNNDPLKARALRYKHMLKDLNIHKGKVAISGQGDLGIGYSVFTELQKMMNADSSDLTFIGFLDKDIFAQAMSTKSPDEVEKIYRMGQITVEVVGRVADYLSKQTVRSETLVKPDGNYLTIGDMKSLINLWLAELGAENPEGTIFAIGKDAGVPHSSGTATDTLKLGQTIVFDIFPCEIEGGYYYDFTRTWCLGYATDEVQALYEQVLTVYNKVFSEIKANQPYNIYQKRTCDLFEKMGHPTISSNPQTENGYVHSVGHGLGLRIHEIPFSGASSDDVLLPGSVFTLEPGLYYPEKGMGVRLENSLWITPDKHIEVLVDYPMDLVLPVKKNG